MPLYTPATNSGLVLTGIEHFQAKIASSFGVARPNFPTTAHNDEGDGFDSLKVYFGTDGVVPMGVTGDASIGKELDTASHSVIGESFVTLNAGWAEDSWYGSTTDDFTFAMALPPGYYRFQASIRSWNPGFGSYARMLANTTSPNGFWFDVYGDTDGSVYVPGTISNLVNFTDDPAQGGSVRSFSGTVTIPDTQPLWYVDTMTTVFQAPASRGSAVYVSLYLDIERYA